MKSDRSIRNICIAAIKRKTIKPIDFPLTKFFETETFAEIYTSRLMLPKIYETELPIAQTIISPTNWTLVTTRQIITGIDGVTKAVKATEVNSFDWGDFKGYGKTTFVVGKIHLHDKQECEVFVETGRASMIIIYATDTLLGQVRNHFRGYSNLIHLQLKQKKGQTPL